MRERRASARKQASKTAERRRTLGCRKAWGASFMRDKWPAERTEQLSIKSKRTSQELPLSTNHTIGAEEDLRARASE